MRRKKWVAVLAASAMLFASLTGCGGSSQEQGEDAVRETGEAQEETAQEETGEDAVSSGAKEPVTLQFYIWNDEEAYMRDVVDQFNSMQEQITVELSVIPSDTYEDKVQILMSSGSGMDIVDLRDMGKATDYAKSDMLLDLTDRIAESDIDPSNYGALWDSSKMDERYYILPTRATSWVLYYNADVFDEAGIPYPEQLTWEEYADLSREIQEKSSAEYGGFMVSWNYMIAATQSACYVNSDDVSGLQYALELANRLYNVDKSHMDLPTQSATGVDYIKELEKGNAAMLPNGEWVVETLLKDQESGECTANWQIAPMPVREGMEDNTTMGGFQYVGITSFCEHPDEAFQFIQYLCGMEGAMTFAEHGMIHAYTCDEAKEKYLEVCGNASVSQFFQNKLVLSSPVADGYNEMSAAFSEQAQLYLLGEQDIETAMNNFLNQRQTIMDDYQK